MPNREADTPLVSLRNKLKRLGFENEVAAKKLLDVLSTAPAIPDEVIEAINNMVSIAVFETRKDLQRQLRELADSLGG